MGFKRRLDFKGPLLQLAHELTVCKSGALRRLHTNGDLLKRTLKWHRPLTPTSEASVLRYTRCQSALQSLTQVFLRWAVWKDGDLKRQSRSTRYAITIKPSHTNSHSDLSGLASDTICIPDALRVMSPPFPTTIFQAGQFLRSSRAAGVHREQAQDSGAGALSWSVRDWIIKSGPKQNCRSKNIADQYRPSRSSLSVCRSVFLPLRMGIQGYGSLCGKFFEMAIRAASKC